MNGSFVQYFDNSYGMFAYETLRILEQINAKQIASILQQALKIVNFKSLDEHEFSSFVTSNILSDEMGDSLDYLDDQYMSYKILKILISS
ncbi:DMP19 family protein [Chondrinema litorale]|uniref:DMP19 family protein n=1 Tax=Chondrinema litorale TaxID=2994555 RepID=UPI002542C631|nr:DUF4375 domain-containing protein [Chondrinema litorale]UZR99625.1 DUF4375 domain-containing protein [Chondrinema litorale]